MTSNNPNKNKFKPDYRSAQYRCGLDRNAINPNGLSSCKMIEFWNLMREFSEGIKG